MWIELALVGGLFLVVVDVIEASVARDRWAIRCDWTSEALTRQAMRGKEGGALRAEFRRSGIAPPEPRVPLGF